MTVEAKAESRIPESHAFEADVARLLHLMVHAVYSEKDVFLRELVSNAADACERLRYEAIAQPALLGESPGDDAKPRITVALDAEARRLTVEDNGIGMSRDEMIEALGFAGPDADAEIILMCQRLWDDLGLTGVRLEINSLHNILRA